MLLSNSIFRVPVPVFLLIALEILCVNYNAIFNLNLLKNGIRIFYNIYTTLMKTLYKLSLFLFLYTLVVACSNNDDELTGTGTLNIEFDNSIAGNDLIPFLI